MQRRRRRYIGGQTLLVAAGCGWTQCEGKPIVESRAGDVIWCLPGHRHWHDASPTIAMTRIAILEALGGKNVEWLEPVTDEQYLVGPGQRTRLSDSNSFDGNWRAERSIRQLAGIVDKAVDLHRGSAARRGLAGAMRMRTYIVRQELCSPLWDPHKDGLLRRAIKECGARLRIRETTPPKPAS